MKQKIFLMMAALIFTSIPAPVVHADPPSQSGPGGRIARALNLTDDQKAQLKPLLSNARQQFQSIRSDSTLTPDQRHLKIRQLRTQVRTQVDQILTPAQQQELDALKAKWRQQRSSQQQQQQQSVQ